MQRHNAAPVSIFGRALSGTTGYDGVCSPNFARSLCLNVITVLLCTAVIYLHSNLYTYKASKYKCAIIRLHCATYKSSLWYMGYVPRTVPLNAHASVVQVYVYL